MQAAAEEQAQAVAVTVSREQAAQAGWVIRVQAQPEKVERTGRRVEQA